MTFVADGLRGVPIMRGVFTVQAFFLQKTLQDLDEWPSQRL